MEGFQYLAADSNCASRVSTLSSTDVLMIIAACFRTILRVLSCPDYAEYKLVHFSHLTTKVIFNCSQFFSNYNTFICRTSWNLGFLSEELIALNLVFGSILHPAVCDIEALDKIWSCSCTTAWKVSADFCCWEQQSFKTKCMVTDMSASATVFPSWNQTGWLISTHSLFCILFYLVFKSEP